jgi:hypothetical protein
VTRLLAARAGIMFRVIPLPRPVRLRVPYMVGRDITAHKRAVYRYVGATYSWKKFSHSNAASRRTYGPRFDILVGDARHKAGLAVKGGVDESLYRALRSAGAYDAYSDWLLAEYAAAHPSPVDDRQRVRDAITGFCVRAEANERNWHYSQARPFRVDVDPSAAWVSSDCSGFVVQSYHHARVVTGVPVPDPAKQGFSGYGNTDFWEDDHPRVSSPFLVGDLAHYPGHVTVCRRGGDSRTSVWTSHGSEAGPIPTSLHYRRDLRFVVRPPLA